MVWDDFSGTVRSNLYKKSKIYEALYVEVTGPKIKNKKITVGNIYRPPRKNNNLSTVRDFIKEFRPTINKLKDENHFSLLAGDYNLNLIKHSQNKELVNFLIL